MDSIKLNLSSLSNSIKESLSKAVSELKDINTLLTEISKANENLSKDDLASIGNHSFDIAAKYGKTAADYLTSVQTAFHSGYHNAEEIAELSLAAQSAGNITSELADRVITATDKAYQMNGSVTELTKALDGMNYIADRNAVNMTELSEGISIAGTAAASLGVNLDEATAALGTMLAETNQSSQEAANAFQTILLYIRQITDAEKGIDAEGLAEYENACNALTVSLKETKNGMLALRDPMEVLRDLSVEYNSLDNTDFRKTNLLNSVGGGTNAVLLDALLRQWDTYEAMLEQFEAGTGSMAAEAEKTAESVEGSLIRLHNTWVDTVDNAADSDAIITIINGLNTLLSVVNQVTDVFNSWGNIGLGAGLYAGLKNVGRDKMLSLKHCDLF